MSASEIQQAVDFAIANIELESLKLSKQAKLALAKVARNEMTAEQYLAELAHR